MCRGKIEKKVQHKQWFLDGTSPRRRWVDEFKKRLGTHGRKIKRALEK